MTTFRYGKGADQHTFTYPDYDHEVGRGSIWILQGEYNAPDLPHLTAPHVLDFGGNIGAFACWASLKWPNSTVDSYEPVPANYDFLKHNTAAFPGVKTFALAVSNTAGKATLYGGLHNCGECGLYDVGEQNLKHSIQVQKISAASLPPADVIKVDTEGSELDILHTYKHLPAAKIVMLEWHRTEDKLLLEALLQSYGFTCRKDEPRRVDRGVLVYAKD